ncbi:hypothetical protein ACET3X_002224 [Alternaria dauci]|uniref:Uncharacterized protein n=1 Tax=Alternaria dauci TaxID=48095 RepID=A0ABR3UNZ1_9PLEO
MNEKGFHGFQNSVQDFTQGRRFFKSQEYMGFGAQSIADGDIIAVLLGFDAPVILRPKASGLHMIVGEAYVHGLMSGEAILGPLPSGWLAQAARSQQGAMFQKFTKGSDGAVLYDPRLGPLWEVFGWHDQTALPANDPRLLPSALQYRGVNVQTFQLC